MRLDDVLFMCIMILFIALSLQSTQALQDAHEEQNIVAMSELRQEMALLQKKILMNTVSVPPSGLIVRVCLDRLPGSAGGESVRGVQELGQ